MTKLDLITVTLEKKDVKNMLCGVKPPMSDCIEFEKKGIMKFTGNQHNEKWDWDFNGMGERGATTEELFKLYTRYCE